jgi:hypothetical protein
MEVAVVAGLSDDEGSIWSDAVDEVSLDAELDGPPDDAV